jgi:hypothetical protein
MSSRSEPIEKSEYVLSWVSEHHIECFLRHGLTVRLVKPDLNQKCITIAVSGDRETYLRIRNEPMAKSHNTAPMEPFDERAFLRSKVGDGESIWRVRISDVGLETVVEVIRSRGLSGKVVRFHPKDTFSVVQIKATRKLFKAAQLEWLQRLISQAKNKMIPNA